MKRTIYLFLTFFILNGWVQAATDAIKLACIDNGLSTHSGIIPMINQVAKKNRMQMNNLYTPLNDMKKSFPNKAHSETVTKHKITEVVYQSIYLNQISLNHFNK